MLLRVRYLLRYPVSGLKEGWELGFDEAELPEAVSEKQRSAGKKNYRKQAELLLYWIRQNGGLP